MSNAHNEKAADPWGGRRCQAMKPDEVTQCKGFAIGGSTYCNFHDIKINDPDKLHQMRVNGGKATRKWFHKEKHPEAFSEPSNDEADAALKEILDRPLETPEDVKALLSETLRAVVAGHMTQERAALVTTMANGLLTAMRTQNVAPSGGEKADAVPEIKEIVHSQDERATSDEYPGSEFGREKAN